MSSSHTLSIYEGGSDQGANDNTQNQAESISNNIVAKSRNQSMDSSNSDFET